jgi:hypothetical protein
MTYTAEVLADSPLAHYRLGDAIGSGATMADASGNARHGAYNGSVSQAAGALVGDTDQAMRTTVSSNTFGYVTSASWMNTAAFTYEVWVKFISTKDVVNGDAIVGRYTPSDTQPFLIYRETTGKLRAQLVTTGTARTNVTDTVDTGEGAWKHVVATYDGTLRLYVNGVSVGTPVAMTGSPAWSTSQLEIGRYSFSDTTVPGADFDEVAVYDYALSAARVLAHYNAGTTVIGNSGVFSADVAGITSDLAGTVEGDVQGVFSADVAGVTSDLAGAVSNGLTEAVFNAQVDGVTSALTGVVASPGGPVTGQFNAQIGGVTSALEGWVNFEEFEEPRPAIGVRFASHGTHNTEISVVDPEELERIQAIEYVAASVPSES